MKQGCRFMPINPIPYRSMPPVLGNPERLTLSSAHWMPQRIHALTDYLKFHRKGIRRTALWLKGLTITYQVEGLGFYRHHKEEKRMLRTQQLNKRSKPSIQLPVSMIISQWRWGASSATDNKKYTSGSLRDHTAFLRCTQKNAFALFWINSDH